MASPEDGEGVDKTVYNVPDLRPGSRFEIEIWDSEYNPVKEVEFNYVVDNGKRKTGATDENGILPVVTQGAPRKIDLYLAD